MQPSVNRSGRTAGAGFMLALSWLAWGCGGEGSAREGQEGTRHVGLESWATVAPTGVTASGDEGNCDRIATNAATLASQWSAATAGQTICLATGSYGTFAAGTKPGVVTVKPQSGATATLAVRFNGANNVRLEGLTITSAALLGSTRNVTITGSRFTGAAMIDGVANSNILFDGNTHLDINAPTGSVPARIHLPYSSSTPSGVTIQNSRFEGGDADGIQTGVAVNILNNQFKDIQENGPNHTDSIQLLGAPGAVVRGNYFLNCATGIVAYDGVERAVIEDNVLDLRGRPWAIELYSDDGSIVRHNTLRYGACDWNLPCGIIDITRKTADDVGRGTVIVDNVATEISVSNGSTVAERHHNLLRRDAHSGELTGAPVFVGGANPTDRSGFRLATGSPGKGAASDGTDVGIR